MIDPSAAPLAQPRDTAPPPGPRTPRQCAADYRWTQPKVLAFLDALSQCGKVGEAARVVGMSRSSAYRLRARLASARFDRAFEGARKTGIRARAAASRARRSAAAAASASSRWAGPGVEAMAARERAFEIRLAQGRTPPAQGDSPAAQGDISCSQSDTANAQGDTASAQGDTLPPQGDAFAHKATLSRAR